MRQIHSRISNLLSSAMYISSPGLPQPGPSPNDWSFHAKTLWDHENHEVLDLVSLGCQHTSPMSDHDHC